MNGNTYLILLAVFLLVIIPWITRRRKLAAVRHILNQKKQNKENREMKELAKRFIGEECIIYTITSNDGSVQGVIKEIDDGGMVIEKKTGELEIVNLDFVTRIREYPRKKNGRKKGRRTRLTNRPRAKGPAGGVFVPFVSSSSNRSRRPPAPGRGRSRPRPAGWNRRRGSPSRPGCWS